MKLRLPDSFPKPAIVPTVFAVTGFVCFALSVWTADAIERFSRLGVRRALEAEGHAWADVQADGLQVILSGTAPNEAMRFRALAVAGNVVDAARLRDAMAVADQAKIAAPEFSIEILRNDDGISLIGLAPVATDRDALVADLDGLADGIVTDMLETADHPAPEGWDATVSFAVSTLKLLPRAKISVTAGRVAVTAISDSAAQKADFESRLRRDAPKGVRLSLDISAPRPVIAPFTLRFLVDDKGARFDACSADSELSRKNILMAAAEAGATDGVTCTIGLGVPTPDWTEAVVMGIRAMAALGSGSITFSDADVALIAGAEVAQGDFDRVVGELESNLPEVFSLKATLTPKPTGEASAGAAEFVAVLTEDGRIDLSGRLADQMMREAVESFARARFGTEKVHSALRLDSNLPEGWPARVLVAMEGLGELTSGTVTVRPDEIGIEGVTGLPTASDAVSRLLSSKLGTSGTYDLSIRYEKKLDPLLNLPSEQDCVDGINAALAEKKITFEPGSAVIDPSAKDTLDKVAGLMKNCADFAMEVGGHTDSQGREEMNLALSEQRARAVIVALQSRRVLTGKLTAEGYGETQPVMANDTEENRERNRRIEFRLLGSGTATTDGTGSDAAGGTVAVQTPDENTIRPRKRPTGN